MLVRALRLGAWDALPVDQFEEEFKRGGIFERNLSVFQAAEADATPQEGVILQIHVELMAANGLTRWPETRFGINARCEDQVVDQTLGPDAFAFIHEWHRDIVHETDAAVRTLAHRLHKEYCGRWHGFSRKECLQYAAAQIRAQVPEWTRWYDRIRDQPRYAKLKRLIDR